MPVLGRVDWALRQLSMGRQLHVVYSTSADGGKLKVKIVLSSPRQPNNAAPYVTQSLEHQLQHVRYLVTHNLCTDRGHRHSNGTSYVHIWVRPPPVPISLADSTLSTQPLRAEAPEFSPQAPPATSQSASLGAAAGAIAGVPMGGGGRIPTGKLSTPGARNPEPSVSAVKGGPEDSKGGPEGAEREDQPSSRRSSPCRDAPPDPELPAAGLVPNLVARYDRKDKGEEAAGSAPNRPFRFPPGSASDSQPSVITEYQKRLEAPLPAARPEPGVPLPAARSKPGRRGQLPAQPRRHQEDQGTPSDPVEVNPLASTLGATSVLAYLRGESSGPT